MEQDKELAQAILAQAGDAIIFSDTEGTIRIFSMDIRQRMLDCLRQMGVVFQQPTLDLDLSVPRELDGPGGPGTNPEQLFAAAYAACFHSALRGLARKAGVDAGHSAVTAQVGVGPEGDMYGLAVTLIISIPGLDQARARELAEAAHQRCPYSRATRGNISVELRVP